MTSPPPRARASRAFVLLVCLAIAGAVSDHRLAAQARQHRALLTSAPGSSAAAAIARDRAAHGRQLARRHRLVALDASALEPGAARDRASDLAVELFADRQVHVAFDHIERRSVRSFVWHGRVDEAGGGPATFASNDGVVMGSIFAREGSYEIVPAGDGLYEVNELDPLAFPTDDPASPDLSPAVVSESTTAAVAFDSAATIDVLVLWTPAARVASGSTAAIQSLVDLAVANANTAYANSGITTRLRLVNRQEISYTETSISADLGRLWATSDGYMDAAHALRDQYGADQVVLVGSGYTDACGIGYLMGAGSVSTSWAPNAFSVVERTCAAGNLSLAHELGHNQGMHHDVASAGGGQGAYTYSYGYQDPGGAFRTVMAYACGIGAGCPRVPYFSTPSTSVRYNGSAVGSATADNVRTLNNTAVTVANFRAAVSSCSYTIGSSSWSAPASGGSSSVTVTVTGTGCSWSAVSSAPWLTVTSGASGSASGTVHFTAAQNTSTSSRQATITIGGRTFTVSQAGAVVANCTYAVSPTTFAAPNAGSASSVTVSTGGSCAWTAVTTATWLALTPASGVGTAQVTFTFAPNAGATSRTATFTVGGRTVTVTQAAGPRVVAAGQRFTFDADVRNDWAVWRPSTGEWLISAAGGDASAQVTWGKSGDIPVPADYDGDGKVDVAVFRPSTGCWYVAYSGGGWTYVPNWGVSGDIPVPADYDGDGKADYAVWRPSNGSWFIGYSRGGWAHVPNWGMSTDVPVPADFDGDRKADLAVWRPATGSWLIAFSSGGWTYRSGWGLPGDTPVPADYDGDGKFDLAVWRPSGAFLILYSGGGWRAATGAGAAGDVPVVGDYDGDGKADPAIWRPTTGVWTAFLSYSSTSTTRQWGASGDVPLARR